MVDILRKLCGTKWIAVALMAAVCVSAGVSGAQAATAKKKVVKKPAVVKKAPVAQPAKAETPAAATAEPKATYKLLETVKDTYVCVESNVTIKEAAESGAMCASGTRIEKMVGKLIEAGMTEAEIKDILAMVRQGEPICSNVPGAGESCAPDGKAQMDFFIMSYCPYGVRLVDNIFSAISADLGDALLWNPYYILQKNDKGELVSLHGPEEVKEDLRQICIREKNGNAKWYEYFKCFSKDIYGKKNQPDAKDWKYCAAQAGLNANDLDACVTNEGPKMAEKDMALSQKYRAQASPTTIYNCKKSVVGAYPYNNFKTACVCKQIKGQKPKACSGG